MYVSAERLAVADRAVVEIFEQTSIAWQAFPHWDTGDPGQSRVRNDTVDDPDFLEIQSVDVPFQASIAQLGAPTPDSLLAEVMAKATELAAEVDVRTFAALTSPREPADITAVPTSTPGEILDALIDARAKLEDAGYRAPSCLITNTAGLKALNKLEGGTPVTDSILTAANINSVHRTSRLAGDDGSPILLVIGRRQRVAHGAASDASPGEEPCDLAVSVPPSLEILGECKIEDREKGDIEMGLRMRFAPRVTDPVGIVLLTGS